MLQSSPELFNLATELFNDPYAAMANASTTERKHADAEIKRIESQISQAVDRIVATESSGVSNALEHGSSGSNLRKRRWPREKQIVVAFFQTLTRLNRTAMNFLKSPKNLRESERFEEKRAVLKLAFSSRIAYRRRSGFRTAEPSMPFKLFSNLLAPESSDSGMVRGAVQSEPVSA